MTESLVKTRRQLNSYQLAAVENEDKACLVNACVGSGKTTVLTEKIHYLHEKGVAYEDMLVVTFTNKAANEILERLGIENQELYFGTFHSVANKLLQHELPPEDLGFSKNFTILLPEDELILAEELIKKHKLKVKYKNRLQKRLDTEYKSYLNGQEPKYKDDLFQLYPLLKEAKLAADQMSYEDLLNYTIELLGKKPYHPKWLIIDEVQDCNAVQVELLKCLYGEETHLFAVGDPNQMIYSFRGSEETLFYYIRNYFHATELSLPINYRSNASILALANRFRQFGDNIQCENADLGEEIPQWIPIVNYYDSFTGAEMIAEKILELQENGALWKDIAVFYRLKEQEEEFIKSLEHHNIPYLSEELETEGVSLLTLHACKGLEFDYVFIVGVNQGLLPMASKSYDMMIEEQRLFFVGITRAKKWLEISYYTNPTQHQALGQPSNFLRMLPKDYIQWEEERTDAQKRENLKELQRQVSQAVAEKRTNSGIEKSRIDMLQDDMPNPCRAVDEEGRTAKKDNFNGRYEDEQENCYIQHPRYGKGKIIYEDDMILRAEFEGYGEKELMKGFL